MLASAVILILPSLTSAKLMSIGSARGDKHQQQYELAACSADARNTPAATSFLL